MIVMLASTTLKSMFPATSVAVSIRIDSIDRYAKQTGSEPAVGSASCRSSQKEPVPPTTPRTYVSFADALDKKLPLFN